MISAEFNGRIDSIEFTYDAYLELDQLVAGQSYCRVSPNSYSQVRESRTDWRDEATLVLSLVSVAGPTDKSSWIDDWLDGWDQMQRTMRDFELFSDRNRKISSIDADERYDTTLFHTNKRLFTQASIQFSNLLEV